MNASADRFTRLVRHAVDFARPVSTDLTARSGGPDA
jgi:hypothetical protein